MEVLIVTVYSPETEPEVLPFEVTSDAVSVTIPEVEHWAILKVERYELSCTAAPLAVCDEGW
ncbi:MAG: hypothetical protein ACE5FA_09645 [Dehalococcoidia bacterium]